MRVSLTVLVVQISWYPDLHPVRSVCLFPGAGRAPFTVSFLTHFGEEGPGGQKVRTTFLLLHFLKLLQVKIFKELPCLVLLEERLLPGTDRQAPATEHVSSTRIPFTSKTIC